MIDRKIIVCGSNLLLSRIIPFLEEVESCKLILISSDKKQKFEFINDVIYVENQKQAEKIIIKEYKSDSDFLISAYWPWKFTVDIVGLFPNNTINFHPSPLPKDRGWYPHVHQIRNKTVSGVTLHKISEKLDQGEIWVQKIFELPFLVTSGQAYEILQDEIVSLFIKNWNEIRDNKIKASKQVGNSNFLSKYLIETPEILELDEHGENLIRLLSSRNIKDRSFIKVKGKDGQEKYVHIKFSEDGIN